MNNRDQVEVTTSEEETINASERGLLAQAHSYRAPKVLRKSFPGQPFNPDAKRALIATCFIPFVSFLAGGFAIYFGRKAFRQTRDGQDRGHWASVLALVAGYATMIPLTFFVIIYMRNGLLAAGL